MTDKSIRRCIRCYERLTDDEGLGACITRAEHDRLQAKADLVPKLVEALQNIINGVKYPPFDNTGVMGQGAIISVPSDSQKLIDAGKQTLAEARRLEEK